MREQRSTMWLRGKRGGGASVAAVALVVLVVLVRAASGHGCGTAATDYTLAQVRVRA